MRQKSVLLRPVEAVYFVDKSRVPCPASRFALAASKTLRKSATPEKIADICSNCRPTRSAMSRAMVVLPVPGGPQRIIDANRPSATMRPMGPSGPTMWSCPITSSSVEGRNRSASGVGASLSIPAASKSEVIKSLFYKIIHVENRNSNQEAASTND